MADHAENRPWQLEDFVDSLVVELDKTRETLAVKAINKALSYTVKDVALDVNIFPSYDGEQVRFVTAQPGEQGASKVTIALNSITDQQVRATSRVPTAAPGPDLDTIGVDRATRTRLRKLGVTSVDDLEQVERQNVDLRRVTDSEVDYSRLAQQIQKSRRDRTPPRVASASLSLDGDTPCLVIAGANLATEPHFPPVAVVNGVLAEVAAGGPDEVRIELDRRHQLTAENDVVLTFDPYAVVRLTVRAWTIMTTGSREAAADALVCGYYGRPEEPRPPARARAMSAAVPPRRSLVVATSRDDGEILPQRDASADEEYVLSERTGQAEGGVPPAPTPTAPPLAGPAEPAYPAPAPTPVPPATPPTPDTPAPAAATAPRPGDPAPGPAGPGATAVDPTGPTTSMPPPSPPKVTEDEFAADLDAILAGRKVYDPASGTTIDAPPSGDVDGVRRAPDAAPSPTPPTAPPRPAPEAGDGQAIFDRIAASMEYATAYDLGSVELRNRFTDFDKVFDARRTRPAAQAVPTVPDRAPGTEGVEPGTEPAPRPPARIGCPPTTLHMPGGAGGGADLSRPFYATGEHVVSGADVTGYSLQVGRAPGVAFSYGEIIAMPDLFESVDQMMAAPVAELGSLKTLIERSRAHAASGTTPEVTDEKWDEVTSKRYLRLAARNDDHFAPASPTPGPGEHGDHLRAWRAHHRRALEEAQRLYAAPENADRSVVPEWPLIINAFGDHFLTDAFAAGHLVDKAGVLSRFRARFFHDGKLTSAAEGFFRRLATVAFTGKVASRFRTLETAEPVDVLGIPLPWHPDIKDADRFATLLTTAATTEPDRVGNLVVRALHDRLNAEGVEVVNAAGDPPWTLTGDGHLSPTTQTVMRRAVARSAADLDDPTVHAGQVDVEAFADRVWAMVPRPTEAGRARLTALTAEYTDPTSDTLVRAAAEILRLQLEILIELLIDEGKLRPV